MVMAKGYVVLAAGQADGGFLIAELVGSAGAGGLVCEGQLLHNEHLPCRRVFQRVGGIHVVCILSTGGVRVVGIEPTRAFRLTGF